MVEQGADAHPEKSKGEGVEDIFQISLLGSANNASKWSPGSHNQVRHGICASCDGRKRSEMIAAKV